MYPDSENYNEKLYRYLHNIETRPICPVCGKLIPYRNSPAGYGIYCSSKCMGLSKERQRKIMESKLKKYGDPFYSNRDKGKQTCIEKYGDPFYSNRDKFKQTCINKYGVDNVFKLQFFQNKCHESKLEKYGDPYYYNYEKRKQTCLDRYGVDSPMKNKDIQDKFVNTMMNKYGVKYAMLNDELVHKLSKSLVNAHKEGKYDMSGKNKKPSKIELQFQQYLTNNNIEFEYQYRSEKYPYLCDFYIPYYDLYIEILGHWTHGPHPYEGSENDIKLINEWKNKNTKYYNQAIYVWSILDVEKRNVAKNNNINYLEVFGIKIDDCVSMFENKIKEIEND